ncbi:MAG: transposase [Bryobacterales bacterium]|nr:transposase [Bryobacterales bacterium]
MRELRERNYDGSYTILTDWLRPQREGALAIAVRRFETPPGKQAQVDWGHLGSIIEGGAERQLCAFAITMGYSRRMKAVAATDQKLGTLLRMHEAAFMELGAVPQDLLYDRMKTLWTGTDDRGEIIWNSVFLDFARYWVSLQGCAALIGRNERQDRIRSKYVRRNFLCGLQGREPASLSNLNSELRRWIAEVANKPVHGTTHEQVLVRWNEDQFAMQPVNGRPPYPYIDEELRKVARDAYVSWMGSRYSVPWIYAGKEVWVQNRGASIEVHYGGKRIAAHVPAVRQHQLVTQHEHHHGIPLGNKQSGKTLIHIEQTAPVVQRRPLAAYEEMSAGAAL